jgi:formate dehydrogenase maturation protein FdhE
VVQRSDGGGDSEIVAKTFEQREARAALLAQQAEAAREPLQFAAALCHVQAQCADRLQPVVFTGHLADDVDKLLPFLRPVVEVIAPRSEEAKHRLADDAPTARTRLIVYWSGGHQDYISRALLQPYAEMLRDRKIAPDRVHSRGHCPFCGGAAWISIRKSSSDAESGFRYLACSLCGLEWNVNRISCPACGEEDPYKLPIFQSDVHKAVRLETCETCRRYVKSIDLTLDARPIPPIDDLVSLSMDLWAADEGYTRIEPGLAGI